MSTATLTRPRTRRTAFTPSASPVSEPWTTPGRRPPMTADEFAGLRAAWLLKPFAPRRTFGGWNEALSFCGNAIRRTGSVYIPPSGPSAAFEAYAEDERAPNEQGGTITFKIGVVRSLLDKAVEVGALAETRAPKLKSRREADDYNSGETIRAIAELDVETPQK